MNTRHVEASTNNLPKYTYIVTIIIRYTFDSADSHMGYQSTLVVRPIYPVSVLYTACDLGRTNEMFETMRGSKKKKQNVFGKPLSGHDIIFFPFKTLDIFQLLSFVYLKNVNQFVHVHKRNKSKTYCK